MGDALRAALRPYGLSQLHCLRQSPLPLSQEAAMWPFSRPAEPITNRIQTLAEMIAYSLSSEVTRGTWKTANGERELVNKALGVTIVGSWPRFSSFRDVRCRGKDVPLKGRDEYQIEKAVSQWREWDDERRRSEALLTFVDAFEQVAASCDTHPKDGDVQQAPLVSGTVPEGQTPNA